MLKGALALVIRYVLYALSGALIGVGAVTMTGNDHVCMSISAVADAGAAAIALVLGGGPPLPSPPSGRDWSSAPAASPDSAG